MSEEIKEIQHKINMEEIVIVARDGNLQPEDILVEIIDNVIYFNISEKL